MKNRSKSVTCSTDSLSDVNQSYTSTNLNEHAQKRATAPKSKLRDEVQNAQSVLRGQREDLSEMGCRGNRKAVVELDKES